MSKNQIEFPFHIAGNQEHLAGLSETVLPADAVIAIDGPAGSGKSTTAKAIAQHFDLLYIDSGAMYRALTAVALAQDVDLSDEAALLELFLGADLQLKSGKDEVQVFWDGDNLASTIRTPEVDAQVSLVASHPLIRREMVLRQQEMGRKGGVVMEGRDIGSVVFPLATAKIYLHATLQARGERRFKQNRQRGHEIPLAEIVQDLEERDRQDSQRQTSPLTVCPDAFVIDSSAMNLDQQNKTCISACLINPHLDKSVDTDKEAGYPEIPFNYRFPYAIMKAMARFFGLKRSGNYRGALPRGFVIAVNHISLWDPPLVGSSFFRYRVHTLAKAELFKPDFLMGRLFRWMDSIPIKRKGFDRRAFSLANRALKDGHTLVIFPEGTRRAIGHPGPVRNGLGIVVQATKAPMLPIFIRGSYGRMPGGSTLSPLEVRYGPYIRWHGVPFLSQLIDKKEVSQRIAGLCESAYNELQARCFAEFPQTEFEKNLGEVQLEKFARRQAKVFNR